jgi:hypothetical protein
VRIFATNTIMPMITKSQSVDTAASESPGMASMIISPGGFFIAMYQLPVSGGLDLTSLTLAHTESHPYSGGGTPRVKYFLATSTGAWEPVKLAGKEVPNPGRYLQPGNRVAIKAQSLDSDEIRVSVGISAMGKQR